MAKNIKAIYDMCRNIVLDIEESFQKDKNAKIDDTTLNTLKSAFEDIIEFEKTHLITAQDQFYGARLMNMNTEIDFSQRGPLDLDVSSDAFTIKFNPLFICKHKYAEFTGMVVSEILKLAYNHPSAYAEYNHECDEKKHEHLEKASSASVSSMVQNDIRLDSCNNSLRLPNDAYTVSDLHNDCDVTPNRKASIDYYFKILEKYDKNGGNGQGNSSSQQQAQSNFNSSQTNSSSQQQSQGNSNSSQNSSDSKNSVATENNTNGNNVHQWEKAGDPDEQTSRVKNMVRNVFNNLSEEQRGYMPSALVSQIKQLLQPPELNWKQILRKYIGTIPIPYRKTRTRLNRRQPYRPDLCGKLPKRVVNIVCVFDTSGSMSDNDLRYCMNEVFNIVKDRENAKITVIECDSEVNKVYEAKQMKDLQLKMSGRGGTSFIPAIEYINGDNKEAAKKWPKESGKFRDALMIYFTDGYGDCSIPKPRTYRNLWVVLKDVRNLSLENPYGEVKALSGDKDWVKQHNGLGS